VDEIWQIPTHHFDPDHARHAGLSARSLSHSTRSLLKARRTYGGV
jgi:hypothetical protein